MRAKRKYSQDIRSYWIGSVFICFMVSTGISSANQTITDQFPKEKIYVHVNSTTAFVGEYLLYSIYCLDEKTLQPSKLSKIAYVDLISEDGKRVFHHKVRLKNGRSYADFFIPTDVLSGNYKLIGYTQWMRNFDQSEFFRQNITIINPYSSNQNVFLKGVADSLNQVSIQTATIPLQEGKPSKFFGDDLTIKLESDRFGVREKVSFFLASKTNETDEYNVSISVRKVPVVPSPKPIPSFSLRDSKLENALNEGSTVRSYPYLPEIRGELLSGKVLDKETSMPIPEAGVSLSIPEFNSHFKTAHTNADGSFHFSIQNEYEGEIAAIQILQDMNEAYKLEMLDKEKLATEEVDFFSFQITQQMEEDILERSFHNQIENAFFSVKPDTVQTVSPKVPFFLDSGLEYILDDYTRFATFRETVVEILEHLWITRESPEKRVFKVRVNPPYTESDKKPLVLMDGLQVLNHEKLMEYNARQIEKVSIGRGRYVFGKEVYDGVISIETFQRDYRPPFDGISTLGIKLRKPQAPKKYFQQRYLDNDSDEGKRIPDFRYQLLWEPKVTMNNSRVFSFFTSDVKGKFELHVEGFSKTGNPISVRETIMVE
ncbi:MAG: hypothetical protein AAGC43_06225 [Bacteroidota bacterium]